MNVSFRIKSYSTNVPQKVCYHDNYTCVTMKTTRVLPPMYFKNLNENVLDVYFL